MPLVCSITVGAITELQRVTLPGYYTLAAIAELFRKARPAAQL